MNSVEFPHSEISGSKDVCSSPKLIAAYHVFHRLPVPRHSPCALCSLTVVYLSINISYFRFSICQRDFTILLSLIAKLQFRLVKLQIFIKIRNFTQLIKSHFAVLYSVFKVHLPLRGICAPPDGCATSCVVDSTIDKKRYTHKISLLGARFCSYTLDGLHKGFWVTQHRATCGGLKWTRTIDLSVISRVL